MRFGAGLGGICLAMLCVALGGTAAEARDRPVAVDWEGHARPLAGVASPAGKEAGRWKLALTAPSGQCTGTLTATGTNEGTWALACPDGVTAIGRYRERANGAGEGTGTDSRGRQVTVLVDAPVRGAASMPQRAPVATTPSTTCGRIEVTGLNITASTIKCSEPRDNSSVPAASATVQTLSFVWGTEFVSLAYNRTVGRSYYKDIAEDEIRRRIAGLGLESVNDASITGVRPSPFRHVRFEGRAGKSPLGCAFGHFSTEHNAEGNRNLIWMLYCKAGATQATEDGLAAAFRAIRIKS